MQDLDAYWGEEWLQDLHLWLGHGLVIAAGMHIAAVLIIQFRHGVPLAGEYGLAELPLPGCWLPGMGAVTTFRSCFPALQLLSHGPSPMMPPL